jgi:hypothetical protein
MATSLCQSTPAVSFGVARYGSALVRFGVARHSDAVLKFGVATNEIGNPVNPFAMHIGGGVVQLYVEPPTYGTLDRYELQGSLDLDGEYTQIGIMSISSKDIFIYNVPPGIVIFLQIRAVSKDGSVSEWIQVRRGVAGKCTVTMQCRCIEGSIIPAGALFTMSKKPGRLIGFRSDDMVVF